MATAYEKVGDVQGALNNSNLGKTKAGLETYGKANALRAAVLAANPDDLEARKKLANNQYTIARTLWMDSQTKEAEAPLRRLWSYSASSSRPLPRQLSSRTSWPLS